MTCLMHREWGGTLCTGMLAKPSPCKQPETHHVLPNAHQMLNELTRDAAGTKCVPGWPRAGSR